MLEFIASIATVCEDVPQSGEPLDDRGQYQRRAIAVVNVGGVDYGLNKVTAVVGENVPLAAFDLFACVIPPNAAGFRGFDALAIDYSGPG